MNVPIMRRLNDRRKITSQDKFLAIILFGGAAAIGAGLSSFTFILNDSRVECSITPLAKELVKSAVKEGVEEVIQR